MNETVKRREWIKNIAIVFLVILLILTFFSNTILNHSLPEVAVQYTTSGTVATGVRVSGTVSASQTYNVTMDQTRTVRTVLVRNGDEVAAGDVLFELEDSDSDELTEARKQLETLQAEYQKAVLGITGGNATVEAQAVASAQAAYNKATSDLKSYDNSQSGSAEQKALDAANRVVESLNRWKGTSATELDKNTAADYLASYLSVSKDSMFKESSASAETAGSSSSSSPDTSESSASSPETPVVSIDYSFSNLKPEYQKLYDNALTAATGEVEKAKWDVANARSTYQQAVDTAKQALDAANQALADKNAANTTDSQLNQLDLKQKKQAVADQQAVVTKLQEKYTDSAVTAKQAGIVTELAAVAGQKLQADSVACTIQLTNTGYTVDVSVTAQQAQRVKVGASATVSGYYWGETPKATVTSIRNDPSSKDNRLVTLTLTGSVEVGTNYNFVLGESSSSYDIVVPKSAVREDNTGTFVLIVTTKSTPLGNRYYATRTDVTVLASDDTQCAVSGEFTGWDYVVTSSSAPIEAGAQVRLANS